MSLTDLIINFDKEKAIAFASRELADLAKITPPKCPKLRAHYNTSLRLLKEMRDNPTIDAAIEFSLHVLTDIDGTSIAKP